MLGWGKKQNVGTKQVNRGKADKDRPRKQNKTRTGPANKGGVTHRTASATTSPRNWAAGGEMCEPAEFLQLERLSPAREGPFKDERLDDHGQNLFKKGGSRNSEKNLKREPKWLAWRSGG